MKDYTRNNTLYKRLLDAAGDDKLPVLDNKTFESMNAEYGKEEMRKNLADYIATERPVFPLKDISEDNMRASFNSLRNFNTNSICTPKDQDTLIQFIENFRTHFKKLPPEDIAYPRSCNNLKKYSSTEDIYQKSTPIHVRGALLYNNLLKKHKLSKYETIQDGDKIKFIALKEPNTLRENVISFSSKLPKEFKLHQYIDYDEMFTKSFLEPLRFIVNAIGWDFEKKATLDEFF